MSLIGASGCYRDMNGLEMPAIVSRHYGAAVDLLVWTPDGGGPIVVRGVPVTGTGSSLGHSFYPQPPELNAR